MSSRDFYYTLRVVVVESVKSTYPILPGPNVYIALRQSSAIDKNWHLKGPTWELVSKLRLWVLFKSGAGPHKGSSKYCPVGGFCRVLFLAPDICKKKSLQGFCICKQVSRSFPGLMIDFFLRFF